MIFLFFVQNKILKLLFLFVQLTTRRHRNSHLCHSYLPHHHHKHRNNYHQHHHLRLHQYKAPQQLHNREVQEEKITSKSSEKSINKCELFSLLQSTYKHIAATQSVLLFTVNPCAFASLKYLFPFSRQKLEALVACA